MAKETVARETAVTSNTGMALADARTTELSELRMALARAVAGRKIPDEAISAVAKKLYASKNKIRGIDVCPYGICIDYFFDTDQWFKALPDLVRGKDARVYGLEVFPWGIPWPEIFRVRVQQEFDEFAAYTPTPRG
jgi:hypothetical protein